MLKKFLFIMMMIASTAQAGNKLAPPCLGKTPVAAAEKAFKSYREMLLGDPKQMRGLVTGGLMHALSQEYQCRLGGELCAIDVDPWSGAQDGTIQKPITFRQTSNDRQSASVDMQYTLAIDASHKEKLVSTLLLERNPTHSCWQLADLITPAGDSLRQRITGSQKESDESPLPPPGSGQE
ncbi:MAG: hypothetical protein HQM04_14505 [Magnetococcales bacterium]|nr:hypothetical protein [Magnetococcales bacterium]MBF0116236.1 hypothetical protein [Magnetococcales bacterium]